MSCRKNLQDLVEVWREALVTAVSAIVTGMNNRQDGDIVLVIKKGYNGEGFEAR